MLYHDVLVQMVEENDCIMILPCDKSFKRLHVRMPMQIQERFKAGEQFKVEKLVECVDMFCAFGDITVLGKAKVPEKGDGTPKIGETADEYARRMGISSDEAERVLYGE